MKQQIYHRLPPLLKNTVASIYGNKLYRRRYDNEYFRDAISDIISRQNWSVTKLDAYQDEKIREVINIAANHVPYYRNLFEELGLRPEDIQGREDIPEALPILEKETLRQSAELFVDERINRRSLIRYHTSGTTGTPICICRDARAEALAYAYYEARWRIPYGISKESSWAMLGGKLVVPHDQIRPPFWVWNSGLRQLYMSSYHLSDQFAVYYLDELRDRNLEYVHGYASSLYSLAMFAKNEKVDDIRFKVALSNAEPLYDYQRDLIEEVFHCRAVDTYGCTEWCFQGSECPERRLHVSPDVSFLEIVDDSGNNVNEGEVGSVIATGLINFAQPLIRYSTGDSARFALNSCKCGSAFPVLESVEGRTDDLIHLADGRRIGRLDPLFKGDLPIVEAQIIQKKLDEFTIKLVVGNDWNQNSEAKLLKSFYDYVGHVRVCIEKVDSIPRTPTGKFRAVISEINKSYPD